MTRKKKKEVRTILSFPSFCKQMAIALMNFSKSDGLYFLALHRVFFARRELESKSNLLFFVASASLRG